MLLPLELRSIPAGIWTYGSTGVVGQAANQLTGWLTSRAIHLVPGKNVEWHPPIDRTELEAWLNDVAGALQSRVVSWVVQLPADRRRRRFNLLLLDEQRIPVGFAKFTTNVSNQLAISVMSSFSEQSPYSFWAPAMVLNGRIGEYSFVVSTSMPNQRHRPAKLTPQQRHLIIHEVQERFAHLVSKPSVVVHGDFAPWNVRELRDGRVALVDWEETTAGVLAADELWWTVCALAKSAHGRATAYEEVMAASGYSDDDLAAAARFWLARLARSQPAEVDASVAMPDRFRSYSERIQALLQSLAR